MTRYVEYLKRPLLQIVIVIMLGLCVFQTMTVSAIPWSDCHGMDPFEDEALLVYDYTDELYLADYMYNWSEANIDLYSFPYADIWYFSGHGGQDSWGKNYLVTSDGNITPGDVPDLNDQHEFDSMRFAYASACYAGQSDWWQDDLPDDFDREGAEAYMGWHGEVDADTSYRFTDNFYHYAIDHEMNVWDAAEDAEDDFPGTDIDTHGSNVSLIP